MAALLFLLAAGETFLTREQALKLVFPKGEAVREVDVELDPADLAKVAERTGSAVAARQKVWVGIRDGKVAGYALVLTEVTKTLPATFIVGVGPDGAVTEVAVLSHEDHIGVECAKRRFVQQFGGRTNADRIRVGSGSGILPVSGATLSCQAVARGVRKAVAVVQHHFLDRPGNVRALLQEPEPVRQKRYVMGSFCSITAHGEAAAVEKAFEEIRRFDRILSDYDPKSELSRLNRERSLEAGPELLAFVAESKRFAELSGGAFDVTVGPLVRLWGFKDGAFRVPSEEEIARELRKVGSARIEVEGRRVRLPEGMELDPGAIGKGMAVDAAAEVLRKAGVKRALVDFGSSVYAIGRWEVAVRDPFRNDRSLGVVTLENDSLSTSGNYEKFFKANGAVYGHILDPRTGRPVQGVASVSVVAPTATESDALSTAAFVGARIPEKRWALVVSVKGELRTSPDGEGRFRKGAD